MKHLKNLSKIVLVGLLGFLLVNCQKEDSQKEAQLLSAISAKTEIGSPLLKSASVPIYLQNLLTTINSLVSEGKLSKGEGQSLNAKVQNAIKSIDKGNTNAVSGQLGAFNTEVEYFVNNSTLTTEQGQALTNVADFAFNFPDGSFIDSRDGERYSVVPIGTQTWMAENLKATKYNDGTIIPLVTDNSDWGNLSTPGYCWYNNDEAVNKSTYGALYNWYTVNTEKLCPAGWHVPSDAEWTTLTTYLGGESVAGGKLKETGTSHWLSPNFGATNETGFTALSSGYHHFNGNFYNDNPGGFWWSSTEASAPDAWYRSMSPNDNCVSRGYKGSNKRNGLSVRCLKD